MSIQTASVVLIPVLVPARGESHTAENLSEAGGLQNMEVFVSGRARGGETIRNRDQPIGIGALITRIADRRGDGEDRGGAVPVHFPG